VNCAYLLHREPELPLDHAAEDIGIDVLVGVQDAPVGG
jgi:hypothetical protein